MQAISLDFLGVPGSALGCATAELVAKHGFPALTRSVWPCSRFLLSISSSLQVQAVSLDFLGVPGSALGCATAELVAKHGFPADKRLGAGIIDGRSVWADGGAAQDLAAALLAQAPCWPPCPRFLFCTLAATRVATLPTSMLQVFQRTWLPPCLHRHLAYSVLFSA